MDCAMNEFCASLESDARTTLCQNCRKRLEKAGSMQMYNSSVDSCMLILDGALCSITSFGANEMNHEKETPSLYLALPGSLVIGFNLFEIERTVYEYSGIRYLTDTWVASFDHRVFLKMLDEEPGFAKAVAISFYQDHERMCQIASFVQSNYSYLGTYHFMKLFESHKLYITQQDIAKIMNHDHSSISKNMKRIKSENPELWNAYMANKNRKPSVSRP